MENTLKKVWKNLSSNEKNHILKSLSNNSLCNNPFIDQYLINHKPSYIINKLSSLEGGATPPKVSTVMMELKDKIDLIEKEKNELAVKSQKIAQQRDELLIKINKCNNKLTETEQVIKELIQQNEEIKNKKSDFIYKITQDLQKLIQSL